MDECGGFVHWKNVGNGREGGWAGFGAKTEKKGKGERGDPERLHGKPSSWREEKRPFPFPVFLYFLGDDCVRPSVQWRRCKNEERNSSKLASKLRLQFLANTRGAHVGKRKREEGG